MPLPDFIDFLARALADGSFVRATLSKPGPGAQADLRSAYLRPVRIRGRDMVAWTWRHATRDEVRNLDPEAAAAEVSSLAGRTFLHLDAEAAGRAATLRYNRRGEPALHFRRTGAAALSEEDRRHDRPRHTMVDASLPCWRELGLTSPSGSVLPSAQDKWRQINKFTEIVDGLLRRVPLPDAPHVADMGSGKGYLTFALHSLLLARGATPRITGIEQREELVALCERVARRSGCQGLTFTGGTIAGAAPGPLDLLIALHACDTATDDAITAGVAAGARVMVLAPCCHKQVRRDMNPDAAAPALAPLLRHGIFMERQAEMLTDAIRGLLLEACGYRTKIFEFISQEHTAKNIMLTAVREPGDARRDPQAMAQVAALKSHFGLTAHALESRLAAHLPAS